MTLYVKGTHFAMLFLSFFLVLFEHFAGFVQCWKTILTT